MVKGLDKQSFRRKQVVHLFMGDMRVPFHSSDEHVYLPEERLLHRSIRLCREISAVEPEANPIRRTRVLVMSTNRASADQFVLWYTNMHQDNYWTRSSLSSDINQHHLKDPFANDTFPHDDACKIRCVTYKQSKASEHQGISLKRVSVSEDDKFMGFMNEEPVAQKDSGDFQPVLSTVFDDIKAQVLSLKTENSDEKQENSTEDSNELVQEFFCSSRSKLFPMVDFVILYDLEWIQENVNLFEWLVGYCDCLFGELHNSVDTILNIFDQLCFQDSSFWSTLLTKFYLYSTEYLQKLAMEN
jgi:hypothetical protein